MREIGVIKWYGGENRNGNTLHFGFIERMKEPAKYSIPSFSRYSQSIKSKEDLFIHKKNILCKEYELSEGTYVSFEVREKDGKLEAIKLKLVSDEDDFEIIKMFADSNEFRFVSLVQKKYISKLVKDEAVNYINIIIDKFTDDYDRKQFVASLPEEFYSLTNVRKHLEIDKLFRLLVSDDSLTLKDENSFEELKERLTKEPHYIVDRFLLSLSDDFLLNNKNIRDFFSVDEKIKFLDKIYRKKINGSLEIEIRNELIDILKTKEGQEKWYLLEEGFLKDNSFYECAPNHLKLEFLISNLNLDELTEENNSILKIKEIFESKKKENVTNLLWYIPSYLRNLDFIFPYLDSYEQVIYSWNELLNNNSSKWNSLRNQSKILAIFKATKENVDISGYQNEEDDIMLKLLLSLTHLETVTNNVDSIFLEFHNLFQNNIVEIAWDLDKELNLKHYLPECIFQEVEYCEGRPWPTQHDKLNNTLSRIFCPRTGRECSFDKARIIPNQNLEWKDWSLMELFNKQKISTYVTGLSTGNEYFPKISGWVNRLNEIRKRLKCSVCGEVMKPRMEYAKNLAKYNVTIVTCSKGVGHDNNIYLNHCWACRNIIDSRESKIQFERYYLCINCGSGPQNSQTYSQGDICPSCGKRDTMNPDINYERLLTCSSCNCTIKLPSSNKITGRGSIYLL